MKTLTLFLMGLLCLSSIAFGQISPSDSLNSESYSSLDSITYVGPESYVFMTNVPFKSLFKLTLLGSDNRNISNREVSPLSRPILSYERKLSPSFSLNTGLHFVLGASTSIEKMGLSIEPRYYLGMKKQIEAGTHANNLSGNYLALQTAYVRYDFGNDELIPRRDGYFALLKLGMQRRLLRLGFVDFSAGVGIAKSTVTDITLTQDVPFVSYDLTTEEKWHPAIDIQASIGLAYGKGRPEDGRLCNVLLCYKEENDLLKINLIDLIQQIGFGQYAGSIDIAYEFKLPNTSWSVELGSNASYQRTNYTDIAFDDFNSSIYLQPRYYYNLKRRIAMGKSVDNLSADFIGLKTGVSFNKSEILVGDQLTKEDSSNYYFAPTWGIQRRIFKRGYFSYQVGFQFDGLESLVNENSVAANLAFSLISDFQLGIAF